MATTVKSARAWVPAVVTTLLTVLLLFACGLVREILDDQDISSLRDPENAFGAYVYGPMAPVGGPGIVGDRPFGDAITEFGGGLVPVVIVVFLFTWLAARAARSGSSFTVLLGAWLGTALGVGLGALAWYQVFLWQTDFPEGFLFFHQERVRHLGIGFYWGAIAGLLIGLVALLTWIMVRPRADQFSTEPETEPAPWPPPGPDELASYPPPPRHAGPPPPATSEETVRAPDPSAGDPPTS